MVRLYYGSFQVACVFSARGVQGVFFSRSRQGLVIIPVMKNRMRELLACHSKRCSGALEGQIFEVCANVYAVCAVRVVYVVCGVYAACAMCVVCAV